MLIQGIEVVKTLAVTWSTAGTTWNETLINAILLIAAETRYNRKENDLENKKSKSNSCRSSNLSRTTRMNHTKQRN